MTIFLDEFENDDYIEFYVKDGLAINSKLQRVLIFQKIKGRWQSITIEAAQIRSAHTRVLSADEYVSINRGGAHGIGSAVGTGIRNAIERSKAKSGSGIVLELRDIELPEVFLSVPDPMIRARSFEAIRQLLEAGTLSSSFRSVPQSVSKQMRRPTQADIDRNYRKAARRRWLLKLTTASVFLLIFGFFAAWITTKRAYTSALTTPSMIEQSEGLRCLVYAQGFEFSRWRQSGYVSHYVIRDVGIASPLTDPWGVSSFTFERGTFVRVSRQHINRFRPGRRPLFEFETYIEGNAEMISAFVPLVQPPCQPLVVLY